MTFSKGAEVRWNIFARELDDVLKVHDLQISKLDDLGIAHPQKVARLCQSLKVPLSFPTLNPEELGRLEANVPLTEDERARLRAGLAAAVERALMDRMDPDTALMAADDVFQILLAALRGQPDSPLSPVRGDAGFVVTPGEGGPIAAALDSLDRATLALHGARDAAGGARDANIAAAESEFARALELLARMEPPAEDVGSWASEWRAVRDEARAGRSALAALLVPAGAHVHDDERDSQ